MKDKVYYKFLSLSKRKNKVNKKSIISLIYKISQIKVNSIRVNPQKNNFIIGKGKFNNCFYKIIIKK